MRERFGAAAAAVMVLSAAGLAGCGGDDDTSTTVTVRYQPLTRAAPAAKTVEPLSASMKRVLQQKADDLTRRGINDGTETITSVTCSSETGPSARCESIARAGSNASMDARFPLDGVFDVIVSRTPGREWTAVPLDPEARDVAKPLRGQLLEFDEDRD